MDINCPYCGAHYELNDSLLPEGNIKVKCKVCSSVFILNKNTGAFKDEPHGPHGEVKPGIPPAFKEEPQTSAGTQGTQILTVQMSSEPASAEPAHSPASVSEPASFNSAAGIDRGFSLNGKPSPDSADSDNASLRGGETSKHPVSDDVMRSIMAEISGAVTEEIGKPDKSESDKSGEHEKGKTTPFQIAMLIVLIVVFLIAAASALVHYNIINIPFLPSGVSDFLSFF